MKRVGLMVILLAGCHRDLDVALCEHNPAYCTDAADDAIASDGAAEVEADTAVEGDTAPLDTAPLDSETEGDAGPETAVDSMTTDLGVDTGSVDSFTPDTATATDTGVDSTVTDTGVDSGADTRDSAPVDTCVCVPGEVASVTGTCPGALEKKTKTCTSGCAWGAEVCAIPKGWTKIADPPSGFEGRMEAGAVWTGGELFVHGGKPSMEGTAPFADGAFYQLYSNSWTVLPTVSAPSARASRTCVFTGGVILCWGGRNQTAFFGDGVEYTPLVKKWSALPTSPLAARASHAGVWATTTKQFLIWGGQGSDVKGDGAAYDPAAGAWTVLPAAPISARSPGVSVWTGTELLIWGGLAADGTRPTDGALYNPSTKTWRKIPTARLPGVPLPSSAVTAGQLHYFGGVDTAAIRWHGESLSLTTLTWSDMTAPTTSMLSARVLPISWSQGGRWFLWAGYEDDGAGGLNFLTNGAAYDPNTKTWSSMSSTDAPTGRAFATALPISNGAIVWSGLGKPGGGIVQALRDGAIYVP